MSATDATPACSPGIHRAFASLVTGIAYYYLTGVLFACGFTFGCDLLSRGECAGSDWGKLLHACDKKDSRLYVQIAVEGYFYDPGQPSNIAFFPVYPLLGRLVMTVTGLRPEAALLLVTHLSLAAAFVLAASYASSRYEPSVPDAASYVLIAMGLFPAGVFFRLVYSEALFLLLIISVMTGMERRWPLVVIAAVVGLASATRPVGIALLPPLLLHVYQRSSTHRRRVLQLIIVLPIAISGLVCFMLYQHVEYDNAWAFIQTRVHFQFPTSPTGTPLLNRLAALASLEPLWTVYDPESNAYWGRHELHANPLFSLHAANPIYFVLAVVLIVIGGFKGWLSACELVLAASLLLVSYVSNSYEMHMAGVGRFMTVIFPIYLVAGRLLASAPPCLVAMLAGLSGFFLGVYGAMFAAGHTIM